MWHEEKEDVIPVFALALRWFVVEKLVSLIARDNENGADKVIVVLFYSTSRKVCMCNSYGMK
jgi:hypothetical protein